MNMSENLTEQRRRDIDLPRLAYVSAPKRNRVTTASRHLARPLRGTGLRLLRIAERLEA